MSALACKNYRNLARGERKGSFTIDRKQWQQSRLLKTSFAALQSKQVLQLSSAPPTNLECSLVWMSLLVTSTQLAPLILKCVCVLGLFLSPCETQAPAVLLINVDLEDKPCWCEGLETEIVLRGCVREELCTHGSPWPSSWAVQELPEGWFWGWLDQGG